VQSVVQKATPSGGKMVRVCPRDLSYLQVLCTTVRVYNCTMCTTVRVYVLLYCVYSCTCVYNCTWVYNCTCVQLYVCMHLYVGTTVHASVQLYVCEVAFANMTCAMCSGHKRLTCPERVKEDWVFVSAA